MRFGGLATNRISEVRAMAAAPNGALRQCRTSLPRDQLEPANDAILAMLAELSTPVVN